MMLRTRQRSSLSSSSSSLPMRFDSSSSLPLSSPRGSSHLYSKQGTGIFLSTKWICVALGFLLLPPLGLYSQSLHEVSSMHNNITKLQNQHKKTAYQLNTKTQLIEAFNANKEHIASTTDSLLSELREKNVLVDTHAESYKELEGREDALLARIDDLESHIQENSQFFIKEEYGDGPYQVAITLKSSAAVAKNSPTNEPIILELAPNMMPHSVHHFLRMISKDLWVGMTFMPQQSARHRIHASPVDFESLNRLDWKFKDAKLSNLSFGEQSPNSCGPYSVGFAGSPGGPDFYVNGGYVPRTFAKKSCFAKVIAGEKAVDSIVDGQHSVFGIESIRLLPKEEMISP